MLIDDRFQKIILSIAEEIVLYLRKMGLINEI